MRNVVMREAVCESKLTREQARIEFDRITQNRQGVVSSIRRVFSSLGGAMKRRVNPRKYFEAHRVIAYINEMKIYRRRFIFRANGNPKSVKEMKGAFKRGECIDLSKYSHADVASYLKEIVSVEINGLVALSCSKRLTRILDPKEQGAAIARSLICMQRPEKSLLIEDLLGLMAKVYSHRRENQMAGLSVSSVLVPMLLGSTSHGFLSKHQDEAYGVIDAWGEVLKGLCGEKE